MENSIKEHVHELDSQLGKILLNVSTINDVRTLLGHVRENMDNLDPKQAHFYFYELHHKVRLMDDLMKYATNELNANYEAAQDAKQHLFDKIVRGKANEKNK